MQLREALGRGAACLAPFDGTVDSLLPHFAAAVGEDPSGVAIVHLAALYIPEHEAGQIDALIDSNVTVATKLAEAATAIGLRALVNVGTAWECGPDGSDRPLNLYAATKSAARAMLEYYRDAAGLNLVHLKLFDTYGRDDPRPKLLPNLKRRIGARDAVSLSSAEERLHLVHIDDVVDALLVAARRALRMKPEGGRGASETAFLPSDRAVSLGGLIEAAEAAVGRPIEVRWGEIAPRKRRVARPYEGGPRLAGWSPRVALAEGLRGYLAGDPEGGDGKT